MTRARSLKTTIRARAAKTGERYTTARRQVLRALDDGDDVAPPAATLKIAASSPATRAATPHKGAGAAAKAAVVKGAVSEAKCREKTGHGLDHWFAVLDRFRATEKGHAAAARHLHDAHGVGGWYSQGITVAYERARGVRTLNQRCDGDFEVSVSKMVAAAPPAVVAALAEPRQRTPWADAADQGVIAGLADALASPASKGFIVRPDGLARYRYKWGATTVELRITPKPGDKSSVAVQQIKLASVAAVEAQREKWKAALAALAAHLAR